MSMASSHLTLAALATSAVADIDLASTMSFGADGDGDFDSALLTGRDGRHWIIRLPRNERAEAEQSADLVALRALSAGIRARLPFAVSAFVGQTPSGGTRAVVYEFVYGVKAQFSDLTTGPDGLAASVGAALAAVHNLPTSFVADAGLAVLTPIDCLRESVELMDRAAVTGLVPAQLLGRWERATEDSALWQFQPTVINGALRADSFLIADGAVTGVLGWHALRVGDPARDVAWLLAGGATPITESALDAYYATDVWSSAVVLLGLALVYLGQVTGHRQLLQRATLYAELEVAQWLLHGVQLRSTDIVDDAVGMLGALVDSTANDVMNPLTGTMQASA